MIVDVFFIISTSKTAVFCKLIIVKIAIIKLMRLLPNGLPHRHIHKDNSIKQTELSLLTLLVIEQYSHSSSIY